MSWVGRDDLGSSYDHDIEAIHINNDGVTWTHWEGGSFDRFVYPTAGALGSQSNTAFTTNVPLGYDGASISAGALISRTNDYSKFKITRLQHRPPSLVFPSNVKLIGTDALITAPNGKGAWYDFYTEDAGTTWLIIANGGSLSEF
jgi:hypothetical protein